jgi:putative oxidoreductase
MDLGLLVLHAVVGLLFVGHGSQKLFGVLGGYGIGGTAGFMESLGLRPGRLHAVAGGLAELVGGALIALGLLVPLGAALIIAAMTTAALTAHRGKGVWNSDGGWELPLVFGAIAFALAGVGAGEISLDAVLGLDLTGAGWALAALGAGVLGGLGAIAQGRLAGRGARDGASAQAHGA